MKLVPQVMEQTAWEIILVSCNLSSAYCTSLFTVRIEQIRKPLQRRIISIYAHSASTLLFVTIFGIVMPLSWQFIVLVHGITATAPVAFLIMCVINKWTDRRTKDLTVLVNELRRMQIAVRRLDPLQSSEQCMEWLNSVDNLRRREEAIAIAEFYGRNFWIFTFSNKAGRALNRARDLLVQGNYLLHPQKHLWGTMNFYQKKVLDFIYNMGDMSGLLGIWGMGDVGKSSLLKLVRDLPLKYDNRSFELLFVRAGIGCTPGQVQQVIATSMGLRLEHNEKSQAKIIENHLRNKSFLLLLDDLWGYLDLEAVGIPLPLGMVWVWVAGGLYRERKVVLTTRNKDLCHEMGCHLDNTIQMLCFSEEDAWRIYNFRVKENKLLPGKSYISVVATQVKKILPKKQSGNVVTDKPLPEEPSGGVGNIKGDKLLPEKPSSSSYTKTQLARPLLHSLFDGKPQQTQDGLPEMTDAYKKVCKFIEATEPSHFLLEKTEPWLMGVCGMRGVGKTALLRLVCNSYRGNICFDHIMFVGAGTGCMVNNVQHAIAINLGLNWTMMSSLDELSRATHISNYLKDKTFLLLLDDIREPLNWWYIGLPPLSSGRKIILATRSRAACALMGCLPNTIEMNCLAEYDAWILFRDKVGLVIIDDHPQVHHLADQMVSRCGGLPLALCALGRAMSTKKDSREWRSAHGQFMAVRLEPCEIDEKAVTACLNSL